MVDHLIAFWVRCDEDPAKIDWQALLPKGMTLDHADVQTFPWRDVQHQIAWWITRRLTAEEWGDLDNAESEVLGRIVGDDFAGTAGPIPIELEPDVEPPGGTR